jgi:menaquinol-cytochrome c reductase iron-sulfur subunit
MSQRPAAATPDVPAERRSFFMRFAAIVCGTIAALFPFAVGWGVIIDPWRRSQRSKAADSSSAKSVPICPLAALPADGVPRAFPVVSDVADAWTRIANQRVGMIYMSRTDSEGKPNVVAFSAECPHLGCFVDYNAKDQHFECPCHKSAFAKDGEKLYGPSRRGLDSLPVKLDGNTGEQQILVAFQKFQKGIAERKSAE